MNIKSRLALLEARKKPPAESSENQLLYDALPFLTEDETDELVAIMIDAGDCPIIDMPLAPQKRCNDMLTGAIARGQRHGIGFKVE